MKFFTISSIAFFFREFVSNTLTSKKIQSTYPSPYSWYQIRQVQSKVMPPFGAKCNTRIKHPWGRTAPSVHFLETQFEIEFIHSKWIFFYEYVITFSLEFLPSLQSCLILHLQQSLNTEMQNDICHIAIYHFWGLMKIKYGIFFLRYL